MIDGKALEALLSVDGAPDEVKHRVKDICGRASEIRNIDISGWVDERGAPVLDSVSIVLRPARVQHRVVKFNDAFFYVLGRKESELRQVRHTVERLVIDEEDEFSRK